MKFPTLPRISRFCRLAFLAVSLLVLPFDGAVAQGVEADDLHSVLKKIKKARHNLTYQGLVVISREGAKKRESLFQVWAQPPSVYHLQWMKPDHPMHGDKKSSRITGRSRRSSSASGMGDELPEFGLFPQRKYLNLFQQNYVITIEPSEMIAGRASSQLTIAPNHLPRFGMRIWYDQLNHFILKREIVYFSEDKEAVSFRQEFREIAFVVTLPDSILLLAKKKSSGRNRRERHSRDRIDTLDELAQKVDITAYAPRFVPKGCELAAIDYREDKSRKIIHLNYTDGLLNFSIFEILGPPPSWVERFLKQPAHSPQRRLDFRQLFAARRGDYQFLLLGNFDREELSKIASSLQPITK